MEAPPVSKRERLAALAAMKAHYRELEKQAKHAKEVHDYEQAKLYDELREEGMLTIKTDDGTYSCKSTIYGNVNDLDAFRAWAEDRGLEEEFIREQPEKGRLNEFVRNCIDSGEELPPGVNWYAREYISITKD